MMSAWALGHTRSWSGVSRIPRSRSTGPSDRCESRSEGRRLAISSAKCTEIINSGRFLEIAHGALGRHDRRWRDPRDLVRVLAREPLRRPNRGDREGTPGRRAYLAAEHGRHPSAVLPGPGRATGLCAILPGRVRNVEGVCGPARIAVVAGWNVRGRDPSRSALASRDVPALA